MPLLCDLLEFLTAGRRHLALAARLIGLMSTAVASALPSLAAERVLDARMHHLRSGPEREWAEFPAVAEAAELRAVPLQNGDEPDFVFAPFRQDREGAR